MSLTRRQLTNFGTSPHMLNRIVLFVVVTGVLIGGLFYSQRRTQPLKVSGFIEADEIRVGSRVGGRVLNVSVEEGSRVRIGDLLVELEPFDLQERRSEAESLLAQKTAAFEKLSAGFRVEEIAEAKARREQLLAHFEKLINGPRKQEIDAAKAELELAASNLDLETKQHQRVEALFAKDGTTPDRMDEANAQLKAARAKVKVATERLALLEDGTRKEDLAEAKAMLDEADQRWQLRKNGYRPEEIAEAHAAVKAAEAALQVIDRQIEELKIVSPVDGAVEAIDLQPGDLVGAGVPVIALMNTGQLWVRAYVPENHLDLSIGQKISVSVDSFPEDRFAGKVTFISRQAEFTPGNVQTPEERSKQVFRIKVVLTEGLDRLRPGMAADVWLESGTAEQ